MASRSDARRDPQAIAPADLATILSRMGCGRVTPEMIEADVETGAPTNADGTIHIVHYVAWLVGEMGASPSGGEHGP